MSVKESGSSLTNSLAEFDKNSLKNIFRIGFIHFINQKVSKFPLIIRVFKIRDDFEDARLRFVMN